MDTEPMESEVVKALTEQYEKKLKEQKEEYEKKLAEQKKDYTETIKTILTTGARQAKDVPDEPVVESEEDILTRNIRKKFKLDK